MGVLQCLPYHGIMPQKIFFLNSQRLIQELFPPFPNIFGTVVICYVATGLQMFPPAPPPVVYWSDDAGPLSGESILNRIIHPALSLPDKLPLGDLMKCTMASELNLIGMKIFIRASRHVN